MEDGTSESPRHTDVTVTDQPGGSNGDTDAKGEVDIRKCSSVTPEDHCKVREILDRVADKWSLLVISLLEERTLRFTELRQQIDGISQRMLTVTLRHLERDGLVCRTVYAEVPPRVEYCLSPLGHTLLGTIQALVAWTEEHQAEIALARAEFDAAREGREAEAGS